MGIHLDISDLLLAFGEIIPQAVCSQYGLSVGAKLSVVVRLLVIIILPIAYPISKAGKGGELTHDETTIIGGALDLSEKSAKYAMTPLSEVFALDINAKLDKNTMELIMRKGHSRVLIHSSNPANIIGLILVKNLIACHPEDETPIRNLSIRKISRFYYNLPLYDILTQFQKGHSHMGVVVKNVCDAKNIPDTIYNPVLSVVEIKPEQSNTKVRNYQHLAKEKTKTSKSASIVRSTEISAHSLPMIDAMELGKSVFLHYGDVDFLQAPDLDSFPDSNEEVIGIITMEDVIEELLQEEIFYETDEYIDIHNKIKINMLSAVRSSPRFSRATPTRVSYPSLRTPVPSPVSSYHNTPILRPPLQPFVSSPMARPSFVSSPTKSGLTSPTRYVGTPTKSSPLKQMSKNPYEKLGQPDC